jgi:hypothetical protein
MKKRVAAGRVVAGAGNGHCDVSPLVRFQTNVLMQVAP